MNSIFGATGEELGRGSTPAVLQKKHHGSFSAGSTEFISWVKKPIGPMGPAGKEGFEPTTFGFGDHYSTN